MRCCLKRAELNPVQRSWVQSSRLKIPKLKAGNHEVNGVGQHIDGRTKSTCCPKEIQFQCYLQIKGWEQDTTYTQ